jgi:HAD superfamily hydrolase (TIGR01509 family)
MAHPYQKFPMLSALLFDLDGTLANTDPLHLTIWQDLMTPHGYQIDLQFYQHHISGRLNADILADLLPHFSDAEVQAFSTDKEHRFRQLAAEQLTPTLGLRTFLNWIENQGWKTAVVTNAPRDNAEFMLATLNLSQRFHTLVVAEELPRAKPHPLPYQESLRRLDLGSEQAIAFEDSVTGVKSAVAAGLYTVGITTTHDGHTLKQAGAQRVISNFEDAELSDLGLMVPSTQGG